MKVLLDTHALIWFYEDNPRLSAIGRATVKDPANEVCVSPASYWELAIKLSTGKISLTVTFAQFIQEAIFDYGFDILSIEPPHTEVLVSLPYHHRDPFDRLIVAQAIVESMPIVSSDTILDRYPIRRIG